MIIIYSLIIIYKYNFKLYSEIYYVYLHRHIENINNKRYLRHIFIK